MASPVRLGLIGCGGMMHAHLNQLKAVPEAKVVALCDTNAAGIANTKQRFPELAACAEFTDYKEMLAAGGMDAVYISTPHTQHYDQAVDSLNAGMHVLMEKPMVCRTDHARDLLKRIKASGKVFLLSYQRHFMPVYRYIRSEIASGAYGAVTYVAALQAQEWKRAVAGTWRQVLELSGGGQLNDSGSHLLDIILWTTGLQADTVSAYIDNCGTPVDINSAVAVRFQNGAQGTFSVVGDSPTWWEDVTIWCEKGAFYVRNGQLTVTKLGEPACTPSLDDVPSAGTTDRNFIDAILGKAEVQSPAVCGLRVIELTEAAWQSAAQGCPVKVQISDD